MAAKASSLIRGLFVLADLTVEQHGQDAPIPASTVGAQRYLCPLWGKTGSPAWASECPLLGEEQT